MRMKLPKFFTDAMNPKGRWQQDLAGWLHELPQQGYNKSSKPSQRVTRLQDVNVFGNNPGDLRMLEYVPAGLRREAPLVVVLHGCDQAAEDFDAASGWSELARRHGFALLYPEQKAGNNPNRCFNWFRPSAASRDRGEVMSIHRMIESMIKRHSISADRVYLFGLSAGGAMTAALMAAYPALIAGGAIVAGLPFGAARDAMGALGAMKSGVRRSPEEWGELVRRASESAVIFPSVSIWHGRKDHVVSASNADALVSQWLNVHDLEELSSSDRVEGRQVVRRWHDEDGRLAVEQRLVADMDHGLPVSARRLMQAPDKRFFYDVGVDAAEEMVKTWGLAAA